jgi:hypothetical protein
LGPFNQHLFLGYESGACDRYRGKKLNLLGEAPSKAQFFAIKEVMRVVAREEKLVVLEQEKLDKEKKKEEKAVAKAEKEALVAQEAIRKAKQKEIDA